MRVIHDALPEPLRLAALAFFPTVDWPHWHVYGNGKRATRDALRIPDACRVALEHLAKTIEPGRGFPDFDYHGAGLHLMPPGAWLGEHCDAESHPTRPWRRVWSLVCFLNDCVGGELLIDGQVIQPQKNTAVLFDASKLHEVKETQSDRRTLGVFYWEVDHRAKGPTSAQFTGGE